MTRLEELQKRVEDKRKELKNYETRLSAMEMLISHGWSDDASFIIINQDSRMWGRSYMMKGNDAAIASALDLLSKRIEEC
jgi:hypothetical protein